MLVISKILTLSHFARTSRVIGIIHPVLCNKLIELTHTIPVAAITNLTMVAAVHLCMLLGLPLKSTTGQVSYHKIIKTLPTRHGVPL